MTRNTMILSLLSQTARMTVTFIGTIGAVAETESAKRRLAIETLNSRQRPLGSKAELEGERECFTFAQADVKIKEQEAREALSLAKKAVRDVLTALDKFDDGDVDAE